MVNELTKSYYTFTGHSDDVMMVACYTDHGWNESLQGPGNIAWEDEFYTSPFILKSPENKSGIKVYGKYVAGGVWMFGVSPIEEGYPMTGFKVVSSHLAENRYSVGLTIEAPVGCTREYK